MLYIMNVLCVGILIGLGGLCCSGVPYFGVVCMVVSSLFCCGLIAAFGSAFVSLLLFIVYLGGMMVVFAYSVAMTEGFEFVFMKGEVFIKLNTVLCGIIGLVLIISFLVGGVKYGFVFGDEYKGILLEDGVGVSLLYSLGMGGLVVCAWALLLALFVVVEMVRSGFHGGGLRSV
uniref:NADH-ubiquinone oxidoreductase chain 6 n=1 Tax=Xerotyphlops vermicularis TaxID=759976 RepID=A0A5C2A0T6_9SAUR|nr:NADH dehydrogenase subunit 6 [Xerotyphlops vermicularis]QEO33847.1 NADH dehydrogenase subunit 6 [Xerotyphlops vermicularis]